MKTQLRFSNMHVHTKFCDGEDTVETMCFAAYKKNLCAIGFAAHAPIPKKTGIENDWCMKEELVTQYVEEVLEAKSRWKGKLDVYLGMEVDYIKGLRSPKDSDITALNLDYIIGSVHYIVHPNGAKPFTVDGPPEELEDGLRDAFKGDGKALMHYYYDAVKEMITLGGFDILGHADLIKKNCINKEYWPREEEELRQKEIALALSVTQIMAEVNTGGINRKKIDEVYPALSFLRFFREYNVPVIITADAHKAVDIAGNYDKAVQTLLCADIKEYTLFFEKSKEKTIWQKEKI